jgi:hypothetical protein
MLDSSGRGEHVPRFRRGCAKLTAEDKMQLASAIAREQGLAQTECNFEFVAY